jgi:hypothetical protein
VANFHLGAANAVSNFHLGSANAVPTCSEKYKCFVVVSSKISPFCHRFYSGCKI